MTLEVVLGNGAVEEIAPGEKLRTVFRENVVELESMGEGAEVIQGTLTADGEMTLGSEMLYRGNNFIDDRGVLIRAK